MIENEDDSLLVRRLPLLSHSIVKIEGVRIWVVVVVHRSFSSLVSLSHPRTFLFIRAARSTYFPIHSQSHRIDHR